jgi:hypothetical protein
MDELTPIGENISHPFENSLNSILDEAHRQILNECPIHLLKATEITDSITCDTTAKIAYVPVPDKFIRISLFKFSDWTNPATKFITPEHPDYALIQNSVTAGSVINPVVVLMHAKRGSDTTPQRYLACYKVALLANKEYLYYIKEGEIDDLEDKVTDALAWLACAKLMQAFEMENFKLAQDRYKEFLISNIR